MDELLITLTCGFECKYGEICGKEDKFLCPVCKNHEISADECLNMTKNKLVINQAMLDLKQQSLCEKLKNLEQFKIDPSFHLDENFSQLKNQIDLRREEIKLLMNKKIDDYCENLFAIIDKQKESKLNEFREKIENIFSNKEITELNKIGTDLDISSKLNLINENMANLDDKLNYIDKTMDALNEKSLVLNHCSYSWDIEKVFGQLGSQVKLNSDSDVIQSETTFQLWIKNFSKFKEGNILEAYSKPVKIKNFQWSIHAKSTRQSNTETALECCLQCRSLSKHNELPLNFAGEMRLLYRNQPDNNLVCKIENLVKYEEQLHGYSFLVPIDEILDPVKGFYNTSDDSITIEAWIKQSIRRSQVKKDSNKFNTGDDLENKIGLLNIVQSDSYEDIDSSSDRTDSDLEDTDSDSSSESDESDSDFSSDSDESDSDFSSDSDESDSDFGNDFDSDSDPYYTDLD